MVSPADAASIANKTWVKSAVPFGFTKYVAMIVVSLLIQVRVEIRTSCPDPYA